MDTKHESSVLTYSAPDGLSARRELFSLLESYRATDEEKERSLGLFLRGALLARIFAITDLYRQIVDLPGVVMDVGTWRGQTAVVCENLRAIFEPLHFNRRIICFDTFEGYKGFSDKDRATSLHGEGTYALEGSSYAEFLRHILRLHEQCNAMGHNFGKHQVIQGDCRITLPAFFNDNPNEFVALAFFDVNAYEPTHVSFQAIWERLVPGGIAAFWQLTRPSVPAEGRVYMEQVLGKLGHTVHRTATYPGLCYIVKR
ncbi:MAG: hypothetical protein ABS91_00750 [Thiobacillus sp. SCN 64-35]|nr:MAG: hypothetical protein ABS91_00750 [Thiobacillus sp. SCN 64-35]